jgi:hypothetical protein
MINHSNRPYGFFGFDKITNTFKIICIEDCLEGEEFTICYGDKCNSDLLVEYGFILDNNIYNKIDIIPMLFIDHIEMFEEKEKFLYKKGIDKKVFSIELNEFPIDLLILLRVYFMNCSEFEQYQLNFHYESISPKNEIKVMDTIIKICDYMLSQYILFHEKEEEKNHVIQKNKKEEIFNHSFILKKKMASQVCEGERNILFSFQKQAEEIKNNLLLLLENGK